MRTAVGLLSLWLVFMWSPVLADDAPPAANAPPAAAEADEPAAPPTAAAAEIAGWTKQLDSDKFVERDQASRKLTAAGKAALPALAEAVKSPSREVVNRAFEILTGHLASSDAALAGDARAALEAIAKSDDAALARRAAALLKPDDPPTPNARFGRLGGIGRIQIGGGIQLGPGGALQLQAGGARVQMRNVNGNKTIDAEENGRKVHIEDSPQNGIAMSVTEKKGDKEETTKYAAASLDELKKKHPEAAKLYEQYNQGLGGALNIQLGAQGVPGGFPPLPPPFFPQPVQPPAAPKHDATAKVAEARRNLLAAREFLKKQLKEPAPAELSKALEQLDAIDKKLEQALEKLEED